MPCAQQSENREDYYDVRSDTSDPLERSNESALENVHILRENLENLTDRGDVEEQVHWRKEDLVEGRAMNILAHSTIAPLIIVALRSVEEDSEHSHEVNSLHILEMLFTLSRRVRCCKLILHSLVVPVVILLRQLQERYDANGSKAADTFEDSSRSLFRRIHFLVCLVDEQSADLLL